MKEKTVSGVARTRDPSTPRFQRKKVKRVKLPSLQTLKRNAQRKIKLINDPECISEIIDENWYKTISVKDGKLIMNTAYEDYEIRKELMNFMKIMNEILY